MNGLKFDQNANLFKLDHILAIFLTEAKLNIVILGRQNCQSLDAI